MVDLTSETCRTIVSYHADKNEASFRNGIDHHDDQMCDYHHFGVLDSPSGRGVQMVIMPYLLTTMVDLTSETCRTIVSYHAYKNETSSRTIRNSVLARGGGGLVRSDPILSNKSIEI